jgi:hypothetical protein
MPVLEDYHHCTEHSLGAYEMTSIVFDQAENRLHYQGRPGRHPRLARIRPLLPLLRPVAGLGSGPGDRTCAAALRPSAARPRRGAASRAPARSHLPRPCRCLLRHDVQGIVHPLHSGSRSCWPLPGSPASRDRVVRIRSAATNLQLAEIARSDPKRGAARSRWILRADVARPAGRVRRPCDQAIRACADGEGSGCWS